MLGGIGVWQLLIILVIIILIFGTKKLRNIGSDLGGALKNFKSAVKEDEQASNDEDNAEKNEGRVIEGSTSSTQDSEEVKKPTVDRQ